MTEVRLEPPNQALLPAYAAALRTGWSPSNEQDVSAEHLAAIEADPDAFLAAFDWAPGQLTLAADGSMQPRLPGATFWITDGDLCGRINLRYVPGTIDLLPTPPAISAMPLCPGSAARASPPRPCAWSSRSLTRRGWSA